MLFSVEQAFEGREEIRAPLKTPAWEARAFEDPFENFITTHDTATKFAQNSVIIIPITRCNAIDTVTLFDVTNVALLHLSSEPIAYQLFP